VHWHTRYDASAETVIGDFCWPSGRLDDATLSTLAFSSLAKLSGVEMLRLP
jgi:hypothetical protein